MKTVLSFAFSIFSITLYSQLLEVEGDVDVNGNKITNVADPTLDQDVATKAYVDRLEKKISDLEFYIKYLHGLDSILDFEGNSYKIVKIGNQFWMAENLRSTSYNDGVPIQLVEGNMEWQGLNTPGYSWYDNDPDSLGFIYGALYNYFVVSDTNEHNPCPVGWHPPSQKEWSELVDFLGGIDVAGGRLKESGFEHWFPYNEGADNNSSGFTGLPGGLRLDDGAFTSLSSLAAFWSSTYIGDDTAFLPYLIDATTSVGMGTDPKVLGSSIRCVKD